MKAQKSKQILFAFLFVLLLVPFIQDTLSIGKFDPLVGAFIPAEKVAINKQNWLEGNFQKSYERWYEENIGLRNFLIRTYNQVDYSLFNTTHGIAVAGKNGYLYEEPYLAAHIGKDFIGEAEINARMDRINFVTEHLKKKGIHVIIVIAPTKADYFSEYLPSFFARHKPDSTNYDSWRKKLYASNVPFIDFNDLFLKAKDTTRFALYPKQGIHWSQYGMYIVADSLLKFMRAKTGIDVKNLKCEGIEMSHDLRSTDYDLGDVSNVLFKMKHDEMPYPILSVENNSSKIQPNVLVIGDSYYWNLYYTEIPKKIFNGANFWYYNYQAYNDSTSGPQKFDPTNCMPIVEKQQVVLILQTVSNLNQLGFEFFEYAYLELKGTSELIAKCEEEIRQNPTWLQQVTEKAQDRKISVDEMIRIDAEWMVSHNPNTH